MATVPKIPNQARALERLITAIERFRKSDEGLRDVSAPIMLTFLLTVNRDGWTQARIAEELELSKPTVSNNLARLSDGVLHRKLSGYGLLVARPHPTHGGSHVYELTEKGRGLVRRLVSAIEGTS